MNNLTDPGLAKPTNGGTDEACGTAPPGENPGVPGTRAAGEARQDGGLFDAGNKRNGQATLTHLARLMLAGGAQAEADFVNAALHRLVGLLVVKGAGDDAEDHALDAIAECLVRLPRLVAWSDGNDPVFAYAAETALNRLRRAHRERAREHRALGRLAAVDLLSSQGKGSVERPLWASEATPAQTRKAVAADANAILTALTELDRALVELRVQTNLTWSDIGAELRVPAAAARQRWHRIRKRVLASMPAPEEL
jgi:RNA polymerase sigma factor (sigma-70 family)